MSDKKPEHATPPPAPLVPLARRRILREVGSAGAGVAAERAWLAAANAPGATRHA